MSASKNQSRFEFSTNKKAVVLCADMTRKKDKKMFLKYLVKMQKENISTQCTLYLDDDDTLAASTETKHLVEVSIFQTRCKFTTLLILILQLQVSSFQFTALGKTFPYDTLTNYFLNIFLNRWIGEAQLYFC